MTITARYASTCTACRQPIVPGTSIEWTKGSRDVRHTDCGSVTAPAATPAPIARVVTYETVGTRVYILGDTYAIRAAIKAAGGHWDGERKAWWVGAAKRADIEQAVTAAAPVADTRTSRPRTCRSCGYVEPRYASGYRRGYVERVYRSGECQSCYEERKMGY